MERVSKTLVAALVAGAAGQAGASVFEFVPNETFSLESTEPLFGGAVTSASYGQGVAVVGSWKDTTWINTQTGERKYLVERLDQIADSYDHMTALDGNHLVLSGAGTAQLFDMATGTFVRDLLPVSGVASETKDGFGRSVAVQGNTAIVTDRVANKAYVFDVTTGQELRTLTPMAAGGGAVGDIGFGQRVAISGNYAVVTSDFGGVGAIEYGFGNEQNHNAYVFDWTTGQQVAEIQASGLHVADNFGQSVSVADGKVLIGAGQAQDFYLSPGQRNPTNQTLDFVVRDGVDVVTLGPGESNPTKYALALAEPESGGRAYVFDLQTGDLLQTLSADLDPTVRGTLFGRDVVLRDGLAVVAAPEQGLWGPDSPNGILYAFDVETGELLDTVSGRELDALEPNGLYAQGWFGMAMALDGDQLFVVNEAPRNDGGVPYGYVFTVPEPSGLLMVGASVLLLGKRRRL